MEYLPHIVTALAIVALWLMAKLSYESIMDEEVD